MADALTPLSAAGNRFLVFDGITHDLPDNAAAWARELAASASIDGVLVLAPAAAAEASVAMIVYNRDGSRPEACGNGLRCVAKLAFERGHARATRFSIETDAGLRDCELRVEGHRVVRVRTSMGVPRLGPAGERIALSRLDQGATQALVRVDMGNPHAVIFVEDTERARVEELGPLIEMHEAFPEGTNVEFVQPRSSGLRVRIWERGVGETAACGTGAAAAAAVAIEAGRISSPALVETRGGELRVEWDGRGMLYLEGPVEPFRPDITPQASSDEDPWKSACPTA